MRSWRKRATLERMATSLPDDLRCIFLETEPVRLSH
jgi:hypothetical protein